MDGFLGYILGMDFEMDHRDGSYRDGSWKLLVGRILVIDPGDGFWRCIVGMDPGDGVWGWIVGINNSGESWGRSLG